MVDADGSLQNVNLAKVADRGVVSKYGEKQHPDGYALWRNRQTLQKLRIPITQKPPHIIIYTYVFKCNLDSNVYQS